MCMSILMLVGSDCGQPLLTCRFNSAACGANGECVEKTVDGLTTEFCSCNPGYIGERCDIVVDDCSSEPCFHAGYIYTANMNSSDSLYCCPPIVHVFQLVDLIPHTLSTAFAWVTGQDFIVQV